MGLGASVCRWENSTEQRALDELEGVFFDCVICYFTKGRLLERMVRLC